MPLSKVVTNLASPLVQLVMLIVSSPPAWPPVGLQVKVGVLVPKPAWVQQAGLVPVPSAVNSSGLAKTLVPFGAAGGTLAAEGKLPPENKWRASAAWLAIVEGGLVKQWRIYADNKPVYDILARSKPNPSP